MKALFCVLVGLLVWIMPHPDVVSMQGWRLFALFIATMLGVVLKPVPLGVVSMVALTLAIVTKTLTFAQAFSGFSHEVVWLIVLAFFIAKGFISTGLGERVAYFVMKWMGRSSLRLGLGLVATDLVLAPAIPSVTARSGGIIFPVMKALAEIFGSDKRMGAFLSMAVFQSTAITSAMFVTAMAGNPLVLELARAQGVVITWGAWASAAIVPGLLSLLLVTTLLYKMTGPATKKTPDAKAFAEKKLKEMGKMRRKEWIMLAVFSFLIVFWILGSHIGMSATVVALCGFAMLVLSGILTWKDVLQETSAWDAFVWFSALITLSGFLNTFGVTAWFSSYVVSSVQGMGWVAGCAVLGLIYFYSHYFFASNIAHIGAMYTPFLIIAIALGAPPILAALMFGFFSSLFGALTHYSSGPAPVLFEAGYVSVEEWCKRGLLCSLVTLPIWTCSLYLWWKIVG